MKLPNQSQPINRSSFGLNLNNSNILPSWWPACGICNKAVGGVGSALVGMGCTAAVAAFEVACNAALDFIPVIGEGPSEVACTAGGVALEAACNAAGGTITEGAIKTAQNTVCGHFC